MRTPEHLQLIDTTDHARSAISFLCSVVSSPGFTEIQDLDGLAYILELIETRLIMATLERKTV
jgi:hypothetical protein